MLAFLALLFAPQQINELRTRQLILDTWAHQVDVAEQQQRAEEKQRRAACGAAIVQLKPAVDAVWSDYVHFRGEGSNREHDRKLERALKTWREACR